MRPRKQGAAASPRKEPVAIDSVQFEEAEDRFLNEIIWTARAGGHPNGERPRWQPMVRHNFPPLVQIVMDDPFARFEPAGVPNEISGQLSLTHLREMGGIRTVVSADDQQELEWFRQHVAQRVLALLR